MGFLSKDWLLEQPAFKKGSLKKEKVHLLGIGL